HRVVLSQRQVLEEELNAKKQELLGTLEVGQIREGVVVRLAEFGAFVDLGGIDGLIHNSELSYARIKHPSEVVKIGDTVSVEIMKFDPEARKVSLSLKHALPDPWDEHADKLSEGNKLTAQIVKVTPNYLLVEIVPGVLAMVPKGEFDPNAQYSPGQEVEVTLLTINNATRRITASIQHVADIPLEEVEKYVLPEDAPALGVTPPEPEPEIAAAE
ncbi:MAG: S1 RNA-binding domain-containing protein, partial [Candidatus Baltobacteraceae bacterium]